MKHKFLLKKSRKDKRDLVVCASRLKVSDIPSKMDLRDISPPIYDQGQVGLCFAHAGCRAFDVDFRSQKNAFITPSRLFLGIMTRSDEGTLNQDAGATMRGTCKAMVKYGISPESLFPYDTSKMYALPPQELMTVAEKYQALKYYSIPQGEVDTIKQAIASGHAVMFGAKIYRSFESPAVAESGIVPMPLKGEQSVGGHALTAVGYDDEKQMFLIANSWGPNWGLGGYCWMPYDYFASKSLVFDLWVITQTELGE
jgi:C1A family cysteine protease